MEGTLMRRLSAAAALLLLVITVAPIAQAREARAGNYLVVLKDAVTRPGAVAAQHARRYGLEVRFVYRNAIEGYAATIPDAALPRIRADERVAFLSPDRAVQAVAQTLPTGINRIQGDASSTLSGNGSGDVDIDVAVIDTGIDVNHPDLDVVGGKNCSTGRPSNFKDGNGHGSHVAGTIGALDDGSGVVGVAPGANLWAVRVLNNAGSGSWSSVVCGVDFVAGNAGTIKVANMSLGGTGSDDGNCGATNKDALHAAICGAVDAGVTFVVAAGNSNANFSGFVPAAYNEVLTVTAVADFNGLPGGGAAATCRSDVDDTAADFSNFTVAGSPDEGHTIAAPGVCILSTWKGGGYNTISGTSMASPHVAGTAALCIASGDCTDPLPSQVAAKLRTDAAAQPDGYGFLGDPDDPITGGNGSIRYYGYLEYAGGY
jgi:subtilisin family serine protease